jgi:hypothetical protein
MPVDQGQRRKADGHHLRRAPIDPKEPAAQGTTTPDAQRVFEKV